MYMIDIFKMMKIDIKLLSSINKNEKFPDRYPESFDLLMTDVFYNKTCETF